MSFNVNGVDITTAIMELEFKVAELQGILRWQIANGAPNPAPEDLEAVGRAALAAVRQKFPSANIEWTPA